MNLYVRAKRISFGSIVFNTYRHIVKYIKMCTYIKCNIEKRIEETFIKHTDRCFSERE